MNFYLYIWWWSNCTNETFTFTCLFAMHHHTIISVNSSNYRKKNETWLYVYCCCVCVYLFHIAAINRKNKKGQVNPYMTWLFFYMGNIAQYPQFVEAYYHSTVLSLLLLQCNKRIELNFKSMTIQGKRKRKKKWKPQPICRFFVVVIFFVVVVTQCAIQKTCRPDLSSPIQQLELE